MSKWYIDAYTARYLCHQVELKIPGHFEFTKCEKCGADYIDWLGHDCRETIEIETDHAEYCRSKFKLIKGGD